MKDLKFISGEFFDYEIPKDKKWLKKYFKTPFQRQFLRYFLIFDNLDYFVAHTGINVHLRYLKRLRVKYYILLEMKKIAKENFDMQKLWLVESGRIKFRAK